jgi:peptide/nickel transport system permease protein
VLRYIGKRLLLLIPVLLGITLIVQLLIEITPGDPAKLMLGTQATPEKVEELREQLGLNDPLTVRYGRYLWNVIHGDFGNSFTTKRAVVDDMMQRFPYTLMLVTLSLTLSLLLGIPLGVYAATHQNTWRDNLSMLLALIGVCMPSFWFALLLIQAFAVDLRWLPLAGVKHWTSWILPCVSLALGCTAAIARQMRSNLLEVIRQDYITTARAKGLGEGVVIYRHALKNAMIPVITVVGGMFGSLLGGVLVSEVIFSVPGLGLYTMTGLNNRDYPVIQSSVLILSTLFAIVILLVDIVFAIVDPRIRSQYTSRKSKKRVKKMKGGADA